MTAYNVEVRGLSVVVMSENNYGDELPLEDGPVGVSEPVKFVVYAGSPESARERVCDALNALFLDSVDGVIMRDRGPSSY